MDLQRRALWVAGFVLAMAAAEAAVAVDLRALLCPSGLLFPLPDPGGNALLLRLLLVELTREGATLGMLAAAAALAGRTFWQRWGFFLLGFGLWDLLYYVWLWAFLGWPPSPMAWDLLFLIPLPWTGPVLAPGLVAAALVGAGWTVLRVEGRGGLDAFRRREWLLEALAGTVLVLAFLANARDCLRLPETALRFPWGVFSGGLALGVGVFAAAVRRGLSR